MSIKSIVEFKSNHSMLQWQYRSMIEELQELQRHLSDFKEATMLSASDKAILQAIVRDEIQNAISTLLEAITTETAIRKGLFYSEAPSPLSNKFRLQKKYA